MKTTVPGCNFRARLPLQRAPLRTTLSIDPGKVMHFAAEATGTPADAGAAISLRSSTAGTDALQGHAQAFLLGLQPCASIRLRATSASAAAASGCVSAAV